MTEPIVRQSSGRRAAAYWFIDGLPEIGFGSLYLIWSVFGLAWGYSPESPGMKWISVGAAVVFIIFFWWDRKILEFVKWRMTYPRTGYVRPPKEPGHDRPDPFRPFLKAAPSDENVTHFRTRTVFLFFLAMQIVSMTGTVGNGIPKGWSVTVVMALVAALEYWCTREEVMPYSVWSVSALGVAGIPVMAWDLPAKSLPYVPLLIGGIWLSAHGWWRLIHYVRSNPRFRWVEGAQQ